MAEFIGKGAVVQMVVRRYMEALREFLIIAERCSAKGWPDRKDALHNAFRLQQLFHERDALRFDELSRNDDHRRASWKTPLTVGSIIKWIGEEWGDAEEDALKVNNPLYADILREIEDRQSTMDSAAMDEPLLAVQRDSEYGAARRALQEILRDLDNQLALWPLASDPR